MYIIYIHNFSLLSQILLYEIDSVDVYLITVCRLFFLYLIVFIINLKKNKRSGDKMTKIKEIKEIEKSDLMYVYYIHTSFL